ncbi:MAG: GtrA family protein [Methyloligellaceae bacterium]
MSVSSQQTGASTSARQIRSETSGFARFCGVGALGFLIDAGLLLWFIEFLGLNPFLARVFSIVLALTMTWAMHRNWTFASGNPDRLAEWSRFATVNGAGGALNYLVYSAILLALPGTAPMLALAAGSAIALLANFFGARLWAFRMPQS